MRFNPPPGWPAPPSADWLPERGWMPDPAWPPAPPDWSWWTLDDDELHRTGWSRPVGRALIVVSATLVVANLLFVIASFLPGLAVRVPNGFVIPFALTIFSGAGSLLFATYGDDVWPRPSTGFGRHERGILRARVPAVLYYGIFVLFVAVFISGGLAMSALGHGGPAIVDGSYYAESHGCRVPVTFDQYVVLVQAQLRLFAGGALLFSWLALVLALASPLPPGPIPPVVSTRWNRLRRTFTTS